MKAERERAPCVQLSETFPDIEIADAYRIQDLWAEARIANGARLAGHEIGLTSRAMQMAPKIAEPDYGRILDDALYNDGAQIRADLFIKPRLEVELVHSAPSACRSSEAARRISPKTASSALCAGSRR